MKFLKRILVTTLLLVGAMTSVAQVVVNEVVVKGFNYLSILKELNSKCPKFPVSQKFTHNYLYDVICEKAVEYNDTCVMLNFDKGSLFTSRGIKMSDVFDACYISRFIPVSSGRSMNITIDGADTIAKTFMPNVENRQELEYNTTSHPCFELLRVLQLYSPPYAKLKEFDFGIEDINGDTIIVNYSYKGKKLIECRGRLFLSAKQRMIIKNEIDSFDFYSVYGQNPRLPQKYDCFDLKVTVKYGLDSEGLLCISYINSEKTWNRLPDKSFIYRNHPPLRQQLRGKTLTEYEVLQLACPKIINVEESNELPEYILKTLISVPDWIVAPYNPTDNMNLELATNKRIFFMERYMPLKQQYVANSNKIIETPTLLHLTPSEIEHFNNALKLVKEVFGIE